VRVLIATVTAGGGHLAAAAALDEAWRALRPRDVVERLDVLTLFSPLHRRIYSEGYVKLAMHTPELYGLVFRKTDDLKVTRRLNRLQRLFPSPSRRRFTQHVRQFKPDAVLCTHFMPLEVLEQIETASERRVPRGRGAHGKVSAAMTRPSDRKPSPFVASIITDFEAHALWMTSCVDLYCVAAEETRARLVARGASPENIVATGIPIAAKFSTRSDARTIRKALGLRDDLSLLLVLSGGFGMGRVGRILGPLDRVSRPVQVVVVCGRNEELRREIVGRRHKRPTRVLGFTTNMHEWMTAADLIITKPGGLTSSEALALGRPLLILDPIPGQETANSDFLLEHGAAAKVNSVEDLPFRVEQLLGSQKLAAMAKAAKALGRPRAAEAICQEVVQRLGGGE